MDPKLRPSFADIVKALEEILNHLKNEEAERERTLLNLDSTERKPISVSKGKEWWNRNIKNCILITVSSTHFIITLTPVDWWRKWLRHHFC